MNDKKWIDKNHKWFQIVFQDQKKPHYNKDFVEIVSVWAKRYAASQEIQKRILKIQTFGYLLYGEDTV